MITQGKRNNERMREYNVTRRNYKMYLRMERRTVKLHNWIRVLNEMINKQCASNQQNINIKI